MRKYFLLVIFSHSILSDLLHVCHLFHGIDRYESKSFDWVTVVIEATPTPRTRNQLPRRRSSLFSPSFSWSNKKKQRLTNKHIIKSLFCLGTYYNRRNNDAAFINNHDRHHRTSNIAQKTLGYHSLSSSSSFQQSLVLTKKSLIFQSFLSSEKNDDDTDNEKDNDKHINNNNVEDDEITIRKNNIENNQRIKKNSTNPNFIHEGDELLYFMKGFENSQQVNDDHVDNDDNNNNTNIQFNSMQENSNQIQKSDNDASLGQSMNDNQNEKIDNLIIPDLSTLLSSLSSSSTSSSSSSTTATTTTNRTTNSVMIQSPPKHQHNDTTLTTSSDTASSSSSSFDFEGPNNNNHGTQYIEELAPAESIAYFYLQNTIGLPSDVMWKITNDYGSVLGFTVQNLKQKIALLKRIMNLSQEDIRTILTKQPSILHMSANRNISQKVLFLVRTLDLSKHELKTMVVAYPCILCYSIPNLQKKISFFENVLGFNGPDDGGSSSDKNELRELLVKYPKLFTAAVDDSNYDTLIEYYHDDDGNDDGNDDDDDAEEGKEKNVENDIHGSAITRIVGSGGLLAKFQFLYQEIGIDKDDLKIIIQKNPAILLYSLQKNLQPKIISLFIMRLRMESTHITKLLKSFPFVMDYNMDNHLLPITRYFLTDLEFSDREFRSILLKFPKIYSYSLFKIKHVVGYLRYQLGMDASQVKRILFQAPQVISLNTDQTLVSKVEFVKELFGLSQNSKSTIPSVEIGNVSGMDDIRKVITGMPTLLLCSVEKNLRPKAEYFLEEFDGDHFELRQAVLTLPTLFGYSLNNRIKPRMRQILDGGIAPIKITVGITMTEENFQKWLLNQQRRIGKVEGSIPEYQLYDTDKEEVNDLPVEAMVAFNKNDSDTGDNRIMHWKR